MNAAIKHRGPDDEGTYVDEKVSLGHVRLSIIDLSEKGHQPMKYEKDAHIVWIVFNGEIYNFKEIKKSLIARGYSFNSNTDTEVIAAAYMEWGYDCVKKFNGMWAFAIYDTHNKRIFLSRDRFGIKPIYYYFDRERLIFSSEIKGILMHNVPAMPNDKIIFDYLYYNLIDHTEETFFKNIKKVMPGHNLIFDLESKKIELKRYYNLTEHIKEVPPEKEHFKEIMINSVRRRLMADVPVGSCLSGGLDSSTIVCCMRELEKHADIKTFSLVFPGKKIDESKYQEIIAKHTNSERYTVTFSLSDIMKDIYELIETQEEPFPTLSIYGQYRIMKLARENGMKVLLDGQGSDEILAGYHWFFGYLFAELIAQGKFNTLRKEISAYRKMHGNMAPIQNTFLILMPVFLSKILWKRKYRHLKKDFVEKHKKRKTKEVLWKSKNVRDISIMAETYSSLPRLLRFEDKNSMRWSIESRVPFCDHELVEYVLSIPTSAKIGKGVTKRILRFALEDIVPREVMWRKDKVAFATPDAEILKTPEGMNFIKDIINSDSFRSRPYWDFKKVSKMLELHHAGRKNYARELWKMVILELWLRRWVDER